MERAWGLSMSFCAVALAGATVVATGAGAPPTLTISVRAMPDRATVEIELRNASEHAIDDPVALLFSLTRVVDTRGKPCSGTSPYTWFDLDTATSYRPGQPDPPASHLRLPVGSLRSLTVNLETLKWGLSSALDVGTLYELWEIAECAEYDFVVLVVLGDEYPVRSDPVRVPLSIPRSP